MSFHYSYFSLSKDFDFVEVGVNGYDGDWEIIGYSEDFNVRKLLFTTYVVPMNYKYTYEINFSFCHSIDVLC